MRILILVDDYFPSTKSAAKMIHDLAAHMVRAGHHVSVVTPSDKTIKDVDVSSESGIQVVRVKMSNLKNIARPLRAWRESRLSRTIWRGAKSYFASNSFDLIIFYSPTIFWGDLVRRLKALWRCPAYLVLRDIFPKWAVEAGLIRRDSIIHRYFRQKELLQYSAADVIGVEAPGNLAYFNGDLKQIAPNVEVLFSWMEVMTESVRQPLWRSKLGLTGKVVFFYGGNIGVAQDMDNILRLGKRFAPRSDIFFLLVGEGSEVPRLQFEIQQANLSNIRILPAVAQNEYLEMLAEFDVGLVSLDRRLTSHNLPGKIFGYMNNSLPILASVNPGNYLEQLLEESDAGLACENGDDNCLTSAALRLADDAQLRRSMGQNSRSLLRNKFSVEAAAAQILAHYRH